MSRRRFAGLDPAPGPAFRPGPAWAGRLCRPCPFVAGPGFAGPSCPDPAVGMIFAAGPAGFSGPFHGKLTNLSAQATIGKERLEKGFNLIENQEAINREYNKYMTYFSLQNVTDKEAVATLLKEVEILSREAGVTIMDMKPQEEAESDKISKQYQINIK